MAHEEQQKHFGWCSHFLDGRKAINVRYMEQRPRQQDVYLHVRQARWTVKPAKPLSFFSKPELLNPPQAPKALRP